MTTKANVLKAIRKNCLECSCGSETEVRQCTHVKCPLYPYRMGRDPNPARSYKNPQYRGKNVATDEEKVEVVGL
jgi:hypothetical protein